MKTKRIREDAWLLRVAKRIVEELRPHLGGARLRQPQRVHSTDTDGWQAVIGNAGKGMPSLQIWMDCYSGCPERKFYACFHDRDEQGIRELASRSKALWPVREVTEEDVTAEEPKRLKRRLRIREFNEPVLENYASINHHYFGFFDRTEGPMARIEDQFCQQAVDFFLDVARAQPNAQAEDASNEVYVRCENRKWVQAHLGRERSRYLATQCKVRDNFCCQVCDMTFSAVYGRALGASFAEAHHIKPLGTLNAKVKTRLEDLITVCANCHRMLHRMDGKPGDIRKLKAIVRKHQKNSKR
jgi:5-methylcytosine-specific restriction endonuclease McrA